jgi:branched-chain amino acid transport system substrate-binding protein
MSGRRSIRFIAMLVVSVFVLSFAFTGCGTTSQNGNEIKIGVNTELTGSIPVVGKSCKNAAEMAADEINSNGGLEVGGQKYKVVLDIQDCEDKAESAAAVAQKFASTSSILAMIGPNASRNAIPAAAVAEASKLPMISPWSTNPKLTVGKQYVFRACFTDDFQGGVVAKFALGPLEAKTAAVLYDITSEYNVGIAKVFKKTFEENDGKIAAFETYSKGDKDFTSQLTKIIASKPDVLFLPNYYSEVPLQAEQAITLGYKGKLMGSDSWGSEELLKLGGKYVEGAYFSTHYSADIATPEAKKFISDYQAKYASVPDDVAALAYDSLGLLFQAIQSAGKLDREAIRNALASVTEYKGITGTMQFKGTGDPIKSAVVIKIENGKFNYFSMANP